jgi:hypothetical protein
MYRRDPDRRTAERSVIRRISTSVGLCLFLGAALPGVGCGSSEPSPSGGSNTAGAHNAGAGGSTPQPSAGAAAIPGGAGAGSPGAGGVSTSSGGAPSGAGCDTPGLIWKSANKTNYTSYPEPGSDECVKYSGCLYEGLFEACQKKQTLDWVKAHNIVAAFPLQGLELHDLCLKSGNRTIVVTVYDTCGDSDCDGCCTQNRGNKDELIDIESFTDQRWGVEDGAIQWADLGPTTGPGCAK